MLALVSGYAAVSFMGLPVNEIAVGFGLFLSLSMGALTLMRPKRPMPPGNTSLRT
jgi:hypothetical protein